MSRGSCLKCAKKAAAEVRACLKIANTPNRQVFCRHTSPIFLERHPGFLRKIGLVRQQNPPRLVLFPFFKQGLTQCGGRLGRWKKQRALWAGRLCLPKNSFADWTAPFGGNEGRRTGPLPRVRYACPRSTLPGPRKSPGPAQKGSVCCMLTYSCPVRPRGPGRGPRRERCPPGAQAPARP